MRAAATYVVPETRTGSTAVAKERNVGTSNLSAQFCLVQARCSLTSEIRRQVRHPEGSKTAVVAAAEPPTAAAVAAVAGAADTRLVAQSPPDFHSLPERFQPQLPLPRLPTAAAAVVAAAAAGAVVAGAGSPPSGCCT